jgi:hypothetical protein
MSIGSVTNGIHPSGVFLILSWISIVSSKANAPGLRPYANYILCRPQLPPLSPLFPYRSRIGSRRVVYKIWSLIVLVVNGEIPGKAGRFVGGGREVTILGSVTPLITAVPHRETPLSRSYGAPFSKSSCGLRFHPNPLLQSFGR